MISEDDSFRDEIIVFFISKNEKGGNEMNVSRFLFLVQQNLPKNEGVLWLEDSALKVGYGDTESFEIRYPGGISYDNGVK